MAQLGEIERFDCGVYGGLKVPWHGLPQAEPGSWYLNFGYSYVSRLALFLLGPPYPRPLTSSGTSRSVYISSVEELDIFLFDPIFER